MAAGVSLCGLVVLCLMMTFCPQSDTEEASGSGCVILFSDGTHNECNAPTSMISFTNQVVIECLRMHT